MRSSISSIASSYYTTLAVDNDAPVARATSEGTGRVTFDASRSSDPDGPVSAVRWDFGDGTSATGARVTHEYTRPGDYVATASVGDSLWPQVTSTATVPVRVPAQPVTPQPAPQTVPGPAEPAAKRARAKRRKRGRCAAAKAKARKAKGRKAKRRAARKVKRCVRAQRRAKKRKRRGR